VPFEPLVAVPFPLSAAPTGLGNTEMQDRMVSSTCEETVKKKTTNVAKLGKNAKRRRYT